MVGSRYCLLAALGIACLPAAASAEAIRYTVANFGGVVDQFGSPIRFNAPVRVPLPDLGSGGTVRLGDLREPPADPARLSGSSTVDNPTYRYDVEGPVRFEVLLPPELAAPLGADRVVFSGQLKAGFSYTPSGRRLGGLVSATFDRAGWGWSGSDAAPASPAPADLLDLMAHPERVRLSGQSSGRSLEPLTLSLAIDPPSPVPEPTSLAVLAVAGLAAACRSRSSGRRPGASRRP